MPEPAHPQRPLLRHPIATGLLLAVGIGVLVAFSAAQLALFLGFAAVLLASAMSFPVGWLSAIVPRGLAVLLTLLLMLGLAVGLGFLVVPTVIEEGRQLGQQVSAAAGRVDEWLGRVADGTGAQQQQLEATLRQRAEQWFGQALEQVIPATLTLVEGLLGLVAVLVLAAFLVHKPDSYRRGVRRLVPRRFEGRYDACWPALVHAMRHWIGGMLVSMTIMGTLTGLGLALCGIDAWLLLGVLTFFGTFVPYVGAIASAIPGLIVGLAESPTHCLYALAVYVGVHVVEGYIVQPLIMKRAVELRPALLLFWQLLLGSAFGIAGVIVATPLLVVVEVLTQRLYVESYLGKEAAAVG